MLEHKAEELFNIYKATVGKKYKYFKISKPKTFKYFLSIVENHFEDQVWDSHMFIEANLKDKLKFPAQLNTIKAWEEFVQHRQNKKIATKLDNGSAIANSLKSTYDYIREWKKRNPDDSFYKCKENQGCSPAVFAGLQGFISPYFMALSRSYRIALSELDIDYRLDFEPNMALNKRKELIKSKYPKVYIVAKKLFGKDIL